MSKTKNTKSALLMSFTSLLLCFAMLIGSTFAWFTDSASANVNKIQAGTLDVQLLDELGVSLEGQTLTWQKAEDGANQEVLWEPGCTYNLQPIVIKNNGNLALKYKIQITGIQGDAKLNEAIEWTITNTSNTTTLDADHSLAAGDSDTLTISGHMKESAGNEYQGLSIDNIAITVAATQLDYEYDSFDNEYDATALYPAVPAIVKATASGTVADANTATTVSDSVSGVEATIPAGTLTTDDKVELTVERKAVTADSVTYDIDLKINSVTPTSALSNPVTVNVPIGEGLTDVVATHNGNPMTKVDNAVNDQEYSYNSETGILTIVTASFSPFKVEYKTDFAAKIGNIGYATLDKAIDAAKDGDTVALIKNVTLNKTLGIDKDIVLDLGQYVITIADEEEAVQINGDGVNPTNFTVKATTGGINVAGTNGACFLLINVNDKPINFTIDGGYYRSEDYEFISVYGMGVMIDEAGDVTGWNAPSAGMTINVKNVSGYAGDRGINSSNKNVTVNVYNSSISANGYSALYIGGGTVCNLEKATINCKDRGILAKSSYVYPDGNLGGEVYIKSGNYTTEQTSPNWLLQRDEGCTLSVTGGTFNVDPSAYVASGYQAVANGDGTWTVTAK
ncbi:MAG: SipW-dependent-type signal peptide-containing protein [Hominicoprocola sp.]